MGGGPVDRATLRGLLDGGGGGARGAGDADAPGGADLRWSGLPAPAPAKAEAKAGATARPRPAEDRGRVFQAVVRGNDAWHEGAPAPAASASASAHHPPPRPPEAEFRVAFAPAVMVRGMPSLAGTAVGACKAGEVVRASHRCGDWVKLASRRAGGRALPADCEAWVLLEHHSLGVLLEQCGGAPWAELPEVRLALGPAGGDAAAAEAGAEEEGDHRRSYEVVSFAATLRSKPGQDGEIVGSARFGEVVQTMAKSGAWVQLMADGPAHESWCQVRHPELGLQLRMVA